MAIRTRVLLEWYYPEAKEKHVKIYAETLNELADTFKEEFPDAKIITYVEINPPESEL